MAVALCRHREKMDYRKNRRCIDWFRFSIESEDEEALEIRWPYGSARDRQHPPQDQPLGVIGGASKDSEEMMTRSDFDHAFADPLRNKNRFTLERSRSKRKEILIFREKKKKMTIIKRKITFAKCTLTDFLPCSRVSSPYSFASLVPLFLSVLQRGVLPTDPPNSTSLNPSHGAR